MTDLDRDELPGDLAALLSEGRPGDVVPEEERDKLLASLGLVTGPFGPGSGGPTEPPSASTSTHSPQAILGSKAAAWIGGMLAGSALTVAGQYAIGPVSPPPAPAAVVQSASAPQPASSALAENPPPITIESLPVASASSPQAAPVAAPEARDQSLRAERELLDVARTAVARGDGKAALSTLQQHSRRFPNGRLAEEREALRIQALLIAGRDDEAKAKAAEFKKSHPDSLMLPGIAPALSSSAR